MKLILPTFILLLYCGQLPADTILFEDFEDSTLTYTTNFPDDLSDIGGKNYFGRIDLDNTVAPPADVVYSGAQNVVGANNGYYGVQDSDDASNSSNVNTLELLWSNINISGFINLNLSWQIAEDDSTDGDEDWDIDSSIRVEVDTGSGFTQIFRVEAAFGDNEVNELPRVDTDNDGVGDGTEITDSYQKFSSAIAAADTLSIRVTIEFLDSADEDLAFDNLLLTGAIPTPFYINGPLSTGPTSNSGAAAPADTTWSEVQNDTGNPNESNNFAGINCSTSAFLYRCADDFVVPAASAGWTVSAVNVYAYQTDFAGVFSPITTGTLRIWSQPPNDALTGLLCGDTVTNVLANSTDAEILRIFNSVVPPPGATPGTTRRIWRNQLTVPVECAGANFFVPGTYWVDWNTSIGTSLHFAPAVTLTGVRGLPGWNARQLTEAGWKNAIDGGNPSTAPDVPLDFPFELIGSGCTSTALTLEDDTVLDAQIHEVCGTIQVGPNYQVSGPNGNLTLRASDAVIFIEGFSVGTDGQLTVENDGALVP